MTRNQILIVDDNPETVAAFSALVSAEGYEPVAATNGARALQCLATGGSPALILLDLRMPVMDGLAFRTAQLEDVNLAAIPVIVLTADRPTPDERRGLHGIAALLHKPVDMDTLLSVVHRYTPTP